MKAHLAMIRANLLLAFREKSVLFFNYVFPLVFFFGFGNFLGGRASGGTMTRVVSMVLVIGILGSGLFGAGIRAVAERETGVLRRYKVTPISPAPLLVSSIVTGWLLYLPSALIIIGLAHYLYGMPWPVRPISLFFLITLGCISFRAIGLIIAAVANSAAEGNILVQLLYMPMLFLSGATIPVSAMPLGAQIVSQFLPASYLNSGVQHVFLRSEALTSSLGAVAALVASTVLATFLAMKLFRWEKDEKLPGKSKAWAVAVFIPFLILGGWQAYSRDHINESKRLDRDIRRRQTRLIRGAQVFVGDGKVIPQGAVLIKNGRIEGVWEGQWPSAESLGAEAVEAAGKTLLPGLIDTHVHLGAPGGTLDDLANYNAEAQMTRALAAYLYSGVTSVRSTGDFTSTILEVRASIEASGKLGADLLVTGPLFTTEGGHGTEYFKDAPEEFRATAMVEFTRTPKTPGEARQMVTVLKKQGADAIKAVLDAGAASMLFQRMDVSILKAIGEQARAEGLPLAVHTGDNQDIADAIAAGANTIEHGSFRDTVSDETFAALRDRNAAYSPTMSVLEAIDQIREQKADLLSRSLVQQVAPAKLLEATRNSLGSQAFRRIREAFATLPPLVSGKPAANLRRAHALGVPLIAGTDSGNMLLFHGPSAHREIQLWVKAGIPPADALKAATYQSAKALRIDSRVGLIKPGLEATLLLVDGNPLEEIAATERISAVFFKGERIDRQSLFDQK